MESNLLIFEEIIPGTYYICMSTTLQCLSSALNTQTLHFTIQIFFNIQNKQGYNVLNKSLYAKLDWLPFWISDQENVFSRQHYSTLKNRINIFTKNFAKIFLFNVVLWLTFYKSLTFFYLLNIFRYTEKYGEYKIHVLIIRAISNFNFAIFVSELSN